MDRRSSSVLAVSNRRVSAESITQESLPEKTYMDSLTDGHRSNLRGQGIQVFPAETELHLINHHFRGWQPSLWLVSTISAHLFTYCLQDKETLLIQAV
jgi:hypothetical protein